MRFAVAILVALSLRGSATALDLDRQLSQHTLDVFAEGLPQQTIRTVRQTHDGYLWLGTYEGLVRFNGVEFTVFSRDGHPGLPSNSIHYLFEDSRGNLWIGTHAGLARYWNGRIEAFVRNDELPNPNVYALAEDPDGGLWIGTQSGLCRFRDGDLERLDGGGKVPGVAVRSLFADRFGRIWIATDEGVFSSDGKEFRDESAGAPAEVRRARAISVSAEGVVFVGSEGGGIGRRRDGRWDLLGAREGLSNLGVRTLFLDERGLLAGTEGGGFCLVRQPAGDSPAVECLGTKNGLTSDLVRSVWLDAEGTVWIGTVNGLNAVKAQKFITLGKSHGLPGENIRVVTESSDGTIWVGTDGAGLAALKSDGVTVYRDRDGLTSNYIRSLGEDSEGNIWAGTNLPGAVKINPLQRTFTAVALGPRDQRLLVSAIYRARDGSLWLGTDQSQIHRLKDGKWNLFLVEYPEDQRARRIAVNCFQEGLSGELFAGTSAGLARLRKDGFVIEAAPSPSPELFTILETSPGVLLLGGTSGAFLYRSSQIQVLPRPGGNLDHTIFHALEDRMRDLWLSSNRGVVRIRRYDFEGFLDQTKEEVPLEYFDLADGLRTLQCNGSTAPAAVKSRDGRLFFATNRGVAVVNPAALRLNRLPPPVHIGRFLADGKLVSRPQDAVFAAGTRNLEIHYDGLSFIAPSRVLFRYRLEGLDPAWVEAGTRRVAYYNVVPPGRYRFRVIASNHDGIWNEVGDSLWFEVEPYFYETPAFAVFLVVMALAVGTGVFRVRIRRLRARARHLELTVAERTQALREANERMRSANTQLSAANEALRVLNLEKTEFLGVVSHDLKSPLTVIRGYAEVLKGSDPPKEKRDEILTKIIQAARRMTVLIQNLLDVHAVESGAMEIRKERCSASQIVESVRAAFEERASAKKQTITLETEQPTEIVADPVLAAQVVENLVSNAVKYSPPGGRIDISIRGLENAVAIEVEDQGPGLTHEDQKRLFSKYARLSARPTAGENSTGLGLSIVRKLTEAMGGRVYCESEPGKGARFVVELPAAHDGG